MNPTVLAALIVAVAVIAAGYRLARCVVALATAIVYAANLLDHVTRPDRDR